MGERAWAAARWAASSALLAAALAGCAAPPPPAAPEATPSASDGVALLRPSEAAALFDAPPAAGFTNPDGSYRLSVQPGGVVHLPSGSVVASDPGFEIRPFAARLPPGTASVRLLRAAPQGSQDTFVADAVLVADGFRARLASLAWANAYREGDDPSSFGPDDVVMYSVDSGTASFASVEAVGAMTADSRFFDRLIAVELQAGFGQPAVLPLGNGLEMIVFPSGAGDGAYPTWVGRDADGVAVAFLTDFAILAHPASVASPSPGPAAGAP